MSGSLSSNCTSTDKRMKHLNKKRFAFDYELRGQKECIRRLEVVKRECIREGKGAQPTGDSR